ncbi:unnamed protein product, partial [Ectocarpus sp. 12 AP-2014]
MPDHEIADTTPGNGSAGGDMDRSGTFGGTVEGDSKTAALSDTRPSSCSEGCLSPHTAERRNPATTAPDAAPGSRKAALAGVNHNDGGDAPRRAAEGGGKEAALKILTYGGVNTMMAVPILYGYAAIIFRHPVFAPYMPALAKLVLFSSMVHQAVFSLVSTLPFAIGQVQDAGLIFLSRMTTDVAVKVLLAGGTAEEAVATALAATAFATASMGVALVFIGKLKLARFVAYLPMPVVGGYLAFIGLFCLEASLGLSTGKDIRGLNTWGMLFNSRDLLLCLPCLVIGVLWSWVSRRYQHFAVLPLTMLAVPAVFYIALALSGESMQNARDVGLIGAITQPAELSWSFSLFRFDCVHWTVLPGLTPVWIGMIFVVAFSSSLDVAAIEIDMGEPLDTNKELNTVGWSNILSGLTGGFTGSYIFSQTLFTRRTGCQSRLIGWFVAVSELAMCVVTIDPMAYVPLLFFAATLSFIAVELSVEWLWDVREKLLAYEYLVLLATFVAIQVVGLNQGLVAGVALSTAIFVISYASERKNTLERVHKRGRFMRPASQRRLLQVHRDKILCVELRGELFFGSSQQVLREVTAMLGLAAPLVGKRGKEATPGVATAAAGGANGGSSQSARKEAFQQWWGKVHKALRKCFTARASGNRSHHRSPGSTRSARSPGSTRSGGLRSRAASTTSRSSSLGGDEERLPLMVGGGAIMPSSHGSLSTTTAANTLSNNNLSSSSGSLRRLGAGTALGGSGSTGGKAVFSKPAKTVSFAGDDDDADDDVSGRNSGSPVPSLGRNGISGDNRGRAALEEGSPESSPVKGGSSRSPLSPRGTSYGAAGAGPRTNGGAVATMEAETVTDVGEGLGSGDSRGRDETAGGAVTVSGGTGSRAGGGEEEQDSAEEGELISFIVLDCSKVTN